MDTCKIVELIETTLTRRGEGKDRTDPIRIITQYWDKEGNLIWEHDPCVDDIRHRHELQVSQKFTDTIKIFRWLLGYDSFPEKQKNEHIYYWRTHLRKKLEEIGITNNMIEGE